MNSPEYGEEQEYQDVVCAAVVNNDHEMLIVKSEDYWMTPGGKVEPGESLKQALEREVKEELQGTKIENAEYYKTFRGITPNSGQEREFHTYLTELEHEPEGYSAEIQDIEWTEKPEGYLLTDISSEIVRALEEDNIL